MTNTVKPLIKHGWLRALLIIIPWFIFYGGFSTLGYFLYSKNFYLGENISLKNVEMLIIQLFGLLGTIVAVWLFTKFIDKKPFYTVGFVKKDRAKDILLGLLVGFIMIALGFYILTSIGEINYSIKTIDYSKILTGIVLFIIVAINEELIFRGYLLNNFMDSVPKAWALIITAVLFGSLHLGNPNIDVIGFSNIVLAGIFLGISYAYTKSLWFPIALHFSWNFFQGTIFGYAVSGTTSYSLIKQTRVADTIWNGGKFGFEASATALIFLFVFTVLIGRYYSKRT